MKNEVKKIDILEALKSLYPDVEEGYLTISTFGQDGYTQFFSCGNSKWFEAVVEAAGKMTDIRKDCYFGLGIRHERLQQGQRGDESSIDGIPGFWMDIDTLDGKHSEKKLPTRQEALDFLNAFPLKTSMLVDSGGGLHAYWIFKEFWMFDDEKESQRAKELSERFQRTLILNAQDRGWKIDNTADLARVLRLPGTYNFKRDPVPVEIISLNDCRYNPDDFEQYFRDDAVTPTNDRPSRTTPGNHPLWDVIKRCHFLRHCRDNAANLPEPHWHAMVCALCHEAGAKDIIHELSKAYPQYSSRETNAKILNGLDTPPMTCEGIREKTGFDCPIGGCGVKCPVHLVFKTKKNNTITRQSIQNETDQQGPDEWNITRELFPRIPFPWEVLPGSIAESLKQLARSHATSSLSLPGAAIAIFSSLLGRTVSVSPKDSWKEPLIFWFSDIRPSGAGKTPAARALCQVLYDVQAKVDEDYKKRLEKWRCKSKKDRGPEPQRARGYFTTDLTLEGLRADMEASQHGGTVCVLDELSSFLSSQNQYKNGKGNDRESWLALNDGKPARISRAGKSLTIRGARVSIFGGIQPKVWQMLFGSENGLFLEDGTIFRFLTTYEGEKIYPLTAESWSEENKAIWEQTLTFAMEWADEISDGSSDWNPKNICLDSDAQVFFINWRNNLYEAKTETAKSVRGFIPKIVGYALRLSGALYCMNAFANGMIPRTLLTIGDVKKGIKAAMFYMGHIVDAMHCLCVKDSSIGIEINDRTIRLAQTLEELRTEIDSGRLAVGFIKDRFNKAVKPENKMKSPHAMGSFLRENGLSISEKSHDANGKRAVKCLIWNEKTESFIKTCLQSLHSLQNSYNQEVICVDFKKSKSAKSAFIDKDYVGMETLKNQYSHFESAANKGTGDVGDVQSNDSEKNKMWDGPDEVVI